MNNRLREIREHAMQMLQEAESLEKLNDARVALLGKKGELTAVLKSMKDISPEERPAFGQMVNETRAAIEQRIEETKARLEAKAREMQMEREVIDVTLPSSRTRTGHPP